MAPKGLATYFWVPWASERKFPRCQQTSPLAFLRGSRGAQCDLRAAERDLRPRRVRHGKARAQGTWGRLGPGPLGVGLLLFRILPQS